MIRPLRLFQALILLFLFYGYDFAQKQSRQPTDQIADSSSGFVSIVSVPSGAQFWIDGVASGTTPFEGALSTGKHIIRMRKEGLAIFEDTIKVRLGASLKRIDTLRNFPRVYLTSHPVNSEVFIDTIFVGKTPLDSFEIDAGLHTIRVSHAEYKEKVSTFYVAGGSSRRLNYELIPSFGFISMEVNPADTKVMLDSVVTVGSFKDKRIQIGIHTLTITHPAYKYSMSKKIDVFPANLKEMRGDFERFSWNAALRTAVIPGLGQIMDNSFLKGSAEFLSMAGSIFFLNMSLKNKTNKENEFQVALKSYNSAATEQAAIAAHAVVSNSNSKLISAKNQLTGAVIIVGVLYVLIVADALIFHHNQGEITFLDDLQLTHPEMERLIDTDSFQIKINVKM